MKFFRDYYDPVAFTAAGFVYQEDREEAEHVLRTADAVKCHVFLFDMEWDMERTYEPVEFGDVVDWEYNPGDDPEFTWQFNRHRFLLCLGQAYRMTGEQLRGVHAGPDAAVYWQSGGYRGQTPDDVADSGNRNPCRQLDQGSLPDPGQPPPDGRTAGAF